jgi:putative peptidoglycan lipid II flippase
MKPRRSLGRIASIVGLATLLSKGVGLLRSTYIAAVFGVGAVADAYQYAYLLPGFLLILIGGLNGPFHTALVSVLAKRDRTTAEQLVSTLSTGVTLVLLPLTLVLIGTASVWIDLIAPGLSQQVRSIAIEQLQIMAPLALLAGWIGISLGALNAVDLYWLPSLSPICSSLSVIAVVAGVALQFPDQRDRWGGYALAIGTLLGAILQWLLQLWAQRRAGLDWVRPRWNFKIEGIAEVMQIMAPAILSSGMMQINIYTDLFFASYIPHAAAALSYAELLAYAPRGILASLLLVPLLPEFARLSAPDQRDLLIPRIRQGFLLSALATLPLSALMIALALPIIQVVYQRQAFDVAASESVTAIFIAYSIGLFPSLGREVLVRVFYGLGDGQTPMRISLFNILLNVGLDYGLMQVAGASGLVLATVGVNLSALLMLGIALHRRLGGLPWGKWIAPLFQILIASIMAGCVAGGIRWFCDRGGELSFGFKLLEIGLAGSLGLGLFVWILIGFDLPEVAGLKRRLFRC